mmetsp:Transcript_44310/g.132287  ORF Transcript_44310/g.132287 Transcript_44310/m.132287 type:complete len:210 (-) Transcript_44310:400-1029(-)
MLLQQEMPPSGRQSMTVNGQCQCRKQRWNPRSRLTRPRATAGALHPEEPLEVLGVRGGTEALVPLGVRVDAVTLSPTDVLLARRTRSRLPARSTVLFVRVPQIEVMVELPILEVAGWSWQLLGSCHVWVPQPEERLGLVDAAPILGDVVDAVPPRESETSVREGVILLLAQLPEVRPVPLRYAHNIVDANFAGVLVAPRAVALSGGRLL